MLHLKYNYILELGWRQRLSEEIHHRESQAVHLFKNKLLRSRDAFHSFIHDFGQLAVLLIMFNSYVG